MNRLRIGTRGSKLALVQAKSVANLLATHGVESEVVVIRTAGDRQSRDTDPAAGLKGQFTSSIQRALAEDRIDLAVHSMKDLPSRDVAGLRVVATTKRESPADALILREQPTSRNEEPLATLPNSSKVGTASVRRRALLRAARPDLEVVEIRGNVDSRLEQLDAGKCDALILAVAGLARLGLHERISQRLPLEQFPPAPCQGALAIEIRENDRQTAELVHPINYFPSWFACCAERAMIGSLAVDCNVPVGAFEVLSNEQLTLHGTVLSPDGNQRIDASATTTIENADSAVALGESVAEKLLSHGAEKILDSSR